MATRTSHRPWLWREIPRLGVLSVCTLACFAVVAYCFNGPSIQRRTVAALRPVPAATASANRDNPADMYTGSILFVPSRGELCSQWTFDNRSGAMWDNGQVSCRPASSASEPDDVSRSTRMLAISKAFKGD